MLRAAVVATLIVALPIAPHAQQPAEPIHTGLYIDKRSPDERTLAERIAHLDATLVVRVVGERRGIATQIPLELYGPLVNLPGFDPPPMIHTEYAVEVVEVLKATPIAAAAGARTTLILSGGEAVWKGRRMIAPDTSPPLVVGDIYVMILYKTRSNDALVAEDEDIFHVSERRVKAHRATGPWAYTRAVLNQPLPTAMAAFRAAARDARRVR